MGTISSVKNWGQATGNGFYCPNLYKITEKGGLFSKNEYYYCTSCRQSIDSGYAANVCKKSGKNQSCNKWTGRICSY